MINHHIHHSSAEKSEKLEIEKKSAGYPRSLYRNTMVFVSYENNMEYFDSCFILSSLRLADKIQRICLMNTYLNQGYKKCKVMLVVKKNLAYLKGNHK